MGISSNTHHYDHLADILIKASTEIGIPENKSYNSGNSQGKLLKHRVYRRYYANLHLRAKTKL